MQYLWLLALQREFALYNIHIEDYEIESADTRYQINIHNFNRGFDSVPTSLSNSRCHIRTVVRIDIPCGTVYFS